MKKLFIMATIILAIFSLTSCTFISKDASSNLANTSTNSSKSQGTGDSRNGNTHNPVNTGTVQGMTLLVQQSIDIDNDGKEEKIEMYTSATKNNSGEVMWDDMNKWLLVLNKSDKIFKLFDGDIQLGKLDFWVYSDEKSGFHIASIITRGESIQMTDHLYDITKNDFISSEILNIKDINMKFYYK